MLTRRQFLTRAGMLSLGAGGSALALTAANGDKLTAEFTGMSALIPDTTFLFIEEHATIIGGTGRFAGAKGEFKVYRLFDMATGTTIGCFEGAISR